MRRRADRDGAGPKEVLTGGTLFVLEGLRLALVESVAAEEGDVDEGQDLRACRERFAVGDESPQTGLDLAAYLENVSDD